MIVDQDELNSLASEADQPGPEADPSGPPEPTAGMPEVPADSPSRAERSSELDRILRLKVPVIVELASRRVSIAAARKLSLGMIIEFDQEADKPLDLLINNRLIGCGETVKVGEYFGLRIEQIIDRATRIRSLGG